jgi:undecaprenyl-diphosphatase
MEAKMSNLNIAVFNAINGLAATHRELNIFMILLAKYIVFLIPAYLTYLLLKKQFKEFLFIGSSIFIALAMGYITKQLYYHPRPFAMGIGIDLVKDDYTSSIPSDHTTAMFAFATALLLEKRRFLGGVAIFLGLLTGIARVYIGVHFPLDIVFGMLFGMIFSIITYLWVFPLIELFAKRLGFDII